MTVACKHLSHTCVPFCPAGRLRRKAVKLWCGNTCRQVRQVQLPRDFVAHARQMRRSAWRVFHAEAVYSAAHFFWFASGARLALFAGEAYAIETALAMTVLCWKSFVWEPKLADVALIRLPGSAVSFDALAADACRVFAFPLSDRIGIFVFVFCAFAAWPFFCVLSPQCFPVDRVASPQLQ